MSPLVTIIVPTYNSEAKLEKCLRSILNQSYSNIELLIIDGGSTDNTLKIIKKYQSEHPSFRYVSEPDKGIYDAMNKGIALASGDWLYFIGSDDYIFDEAVFEEIFTNTSLIGNDVIYGDVWNEHLNGRYAGVFSYEKLTETFICHQAIIYHRRVFEKLGSFNTDYRVYAHIALDIQAFCNKELTWGYTDTIIAFYGAGGYSAGTYDAAFWNDAEALFLRCLSPHVPKNKVYKALEPVIKYEPTFKNASLLLRAIYHTRNPLLLRHVLHKYHRVLVLTIRKFLR
jgi:glycosyltransferase involved in cell wall biosynthesis